MISRKDFNKAVREFETTHKKNITRCLDSAETEKAFFETPIIHAYLSRKDTQVTFAQRHPKLFNSRRKDYKKTDHYELTVYKKKPFKIPYRAGDITTPEFYNRYTNYDTNHFFTEKLKYLNELSTDINVDSRILSSSEIAHDLTLVSLAPKTDKVIPRFRIYSLSDNAHATTLLVIMNPVTRKPHIALLLNSSTDDEHFTYIKDRLLQPQRFTPFNSDQNVLENHFSDVFGRNINDPSLFKIPGLQYNLSANIACVVNSKDERQGLFRIFPAIKSVFTLNKVDYLSAVKGKTQKARINLIHQPAFPIIYVPHPLQHEQENDNNCVLYSMHFIQAIVELLNKSSTAEEVFEYAEAGIWNYAKTQLINIFSESLKAHLPFYYNPKTKEPHSAQKLREFHLRQRWNIGSESFSMLCPIQSQLESKQESGQMEGRGRNKSYLLPPAQIRTCATNASGSYLG